MTTTQQHTTPEPDERDVLLARMLLGLQAPFEDAPFDGVSTEDDSVDALLGFLSEYKAAVQEGPFDSVESSPDGQLKPDGLKSQDQRKSDNANSDDASARIWMSISAEMDASKSRDAVITPIGRSARNNTRTRNRMGSPLLRIAAMLMVALVGGLLLWTITSTPDTDLLAAASTESVVFTLPDGSQITLRPHSNLFSASDIASDRVSDGAFDFRLEGEAYFDVVHNPNRAFTVHTGSAMVQVTGTRFVVRSYSSDETEVFLEEGGVTVQSLITAEVLAMQSGQSIRVAQNLPLQPELAEADRYLLWMSNEMLLTNRTVADVARELSNHFNIDVRVAPGWTDEQLEGRILLDDPEQVLQDIALALGARIYIQNNVYLIE
ncbi:MAG: FecR domain-containing protein [Balneolales bacterium]|nr:FecR domain-containing protein [Balneolales bacterium]